MEAFTSAQNDRLSREMARYCREFFSTETSGRTEQDLIGYITQVRDNAKKYGLSTRQDLYRFLNLSMFYGIELEHSPELNWMHEYLTESRISDPGKRLNRLYRECIKRAEKEELPENSGDMRS